MPYVEEATFNAKMKQMGDYIDSLKAAVKGSMQRPLAEPEEKMAENVGLFLLASRTGNQKAISTLADRGFGSEVEKALAEGVTSTGGALVPQVLHAELIDLMKLYGVFRRNARVVDMQADNDVWPKITARPTVYVPGEGSTITTSDLTLANVSLVAKKMACLTPVSSELMEDSVVSVAQLLGEQFAAAMAEAEDKAGFLGDGTSTYWGYTGLTGGFKNLTSWDSQSANAILGGLVTAAGNLWSEITLANLYSMIKTLPNRFQRKARWFFHQNFLWDVILPLISAESGGVPALGDPRFWQDGPNMYFLGHPIEFVDVMPSSSANSSICAFYGDLKLACYLGERRRLQIDTDASVYFATDQVGVRGLQRVGICPCGVGDDDTAEAVTALVTFAS